MSKTNKRRHPVFSAVISIAVVAVSVYALLLFLMYFFQSKLVYFPFRDIHATPESVGLSFEDVTVTTADGESLHGWFIPAADSSPTILFCHGNGGNISWLMETIQAFHGLQLNTLVFDYRGYGKSSGSPDEEGTYKDVRAFWDYLVLKRNCKPSEIVLIGRSLGGAVAAWLAEQESPHSLILESSFTSLPDVGADVYPFLPVRSLSQYQYNTLNRLKNIRCPVLVIHSPDDEIIPYKHGERLFEEAREPKQFLRIQGGHNEGFYVSRSIYADGIRRFLARED